MFKLPFKTGIRAAYNVLDKPSFLSEPWLIYPAKHKSNGKLVSVFIFDKTKFEAQINKMSGMSKNPRVIISECYELIKFEISQLTKLRHPQILTIYEVLEETKLKFLFVSEPVDDNLLTVSSRKLDDLSIQKGILEIAKGLQFLHNNCSIIHSNLQPSSIYINNQGDWKLGGFKFLQNLNEISPQERENYYIMNNSSLVPFSNINLNYTAPELILDNQQKLGFANDIFSLGCLIYYLYNEDNLINCFDPNSITEYKQEFQKFANKFYNHRSSDLKYVLKNVPENIYPLLMQTLSRYPFDRISVDQFIDSEFFDGSIIKAMWFVDEFSTKNISEKLIFMNGLLNDSILSQFPIHFKNQKLLPLMIELIVNELNILKGKKLDNDINELLTYALTITLEIGDGISGLSFQDKIYDQLLLLKKKDCTFTLLINTSVKIRLVLIEHLSTLQSKLKDKQLVSVIKELSSLCLTSSPLETDLQADQIKLQDLFLTKLITVMDQFDFPYIKNSLFPLLCQVFKTTTILSTKITTIDLFEKLIDQKIIDKIIVADQLLPILKNLKSRDKRIVGETLKLFGKLSSSEHISLDLESLVDTVLSQCFKLAFACNDCNQLEFKVFIDEINRIQSILTTKKIDSLAKHSDTNFNSIINTRHSIDTSAPKTVPIKPTSHETPIKPTTTTKPIKNQPLSLKNKNHQSQNQNQTLKPKLNFGDTSSNQNNNLLDTLNKTWGKRNIPEPETVNDDDDDFEEFQKAETTPQINWNSEINKSLPMNQRMSQKTTTNAQPRKYPPGFDSNMVLTPNGTGGSQTKPTIQNQKNSDLLDLL